MKSYILKIGMTTVVLVSTCMLSACGPAIIASAATSATMLHDRRTSASLMEDQAIEMKANRMLHDHQELLADARVRIISYNRNILLVGQAPNQQASNEIEHLMTQVDEVKKVYNEIALSPTAGIKTVSNDSWITTKIKSNSMNGRNGVDPLNVKVVTEDGVVYLMGIVSRKEADQASDLARQTEGVKRVVRVFEYND